MGGLEAEAAPRGTGHLGGGGGKELGAPTRSGCPFLQGQCQAGGPHLEAPLGPSLPSGPCPLWSLVALQVLVVLSALGALGRQRDKAVDTASPDAPVL